MRSSLAQVLATDDDERLGWAKDLPLLPHQVEGCRWMKGREADAFRGGILNDVSPLEQPLVCTILTFKQDVGGFTSLVPNQD